MAAPERRLSAEAKPFAPPSPLAKVVSRDDDEPPRRRGVIVDNLEDETVVGSESDLELDLECSVCAEPFDCKTRTPMVLPCSGSHEICALCVVALRDRFGGDDGAFHCPSCREPILPCFPINKNRGLMAALRLNERLARRRR
uniref:RING-type domain-containing protein n=1 Tax=Pelagomonas calceolata TaxID=35677 RepID=A0A7S4EAP9_9STRA|mmetsp:Transcript_18109/g.51620  ORF Transcript_18109/g.51620 Transcript_18109/m.51620 type:complete len:142 (+) Transcript_18109:191-616(+)